MVYALLALAAGLRKVTLLRTPAPKPTRVIMGRHPRATMGLP
jgi:hypothetical protein